MSLFDPSLDFATDYNPLCLAFTILNFTLCPVPSLGVLPFTGPVTYLLLYICLSLVGIFSSEFPHTKKLVQPSQCIPTQLLVQMCMLFCV